MFVIHQKCLWFSVMKDNSQPCLYPVLRHNSPSSFSSESEAPGVHRSLQISVSVLCFLQSLKQVTCLQRKVSCFMRFIGQLHLEITILIVAFLL